MARQRFGAAHTQEKLNIVAKYLPAFTTALKRTPFTLHYIDAFAGTGLCEITVDGRRRTVPGSAFYALECDPPFHKLLFVEKSPSKVKVLRSLASMVPQRAVEIRTDDANIAIPNYLQTLGPNDRGIVFLDPFGMQVAWETLERIAQCRCVDVWYLFPLSGLYRQAARDADQIDESKEDSLNRVLGPHNWRKAFYKRAPHDDLFRGAYDVRVADPLEITAQVKEWLASAFPKVLEPKILYSTRPDGTRGSPLFALFFLVSNPDGKAIGLASRIANAVLKS